MERRLVVDLTRMGRNDERGGLGPRRMAVGRIRIRDVHDVIQRQADRYLPALNLSGRQMDAVRTRAAEMRERAPELVVFGGPGPIRAIRALLAALTVRSDVLFLDSPDTAAIEAALERPACWLLLEGPGWADAVAVAAAQSGRSVAIAGTGEEDVPPEGWWFHDPVASDGRFGIFGEGALTVAAWAGIDVEELLGGATDMLSSVVRPGLFDNPAYTLAVATAAAVKELQFEAVVHFVSSGRMGPLADWMGRLWMGMVVGAPLVDGLRRPIALTTLGGVVGDEELLAATVGRRDTLAIVWDGDGSEDVMTRALLDAWTREGAPVIRVKIPGINAGTVGAVLVLGLTAGVTAALCLDVDPFSADGNRAWKAAVARLQPTVE